MKKILVATKKPFDPAAIPQMKEIVDNAGFSVEIFEKYEEQSELVNAVKDIDALIVRSDKVTREVVEAAANLKIVVRAGAGYDNVDLDACTEKGITVMNTPGQNANAVAELALGMMVYQARGQFNGKPGTELRNKTLGIHAYGNVGRLVANIAKGFGMHVSAYDPFIDKNEITKDGLKVYNSVEELYANNQYVSLHIPANDKTKGSIGYDLLSKMPENAVLVNTARKEIINEEELLKVMGSREDFTYISDIAPDCKDKIAEKYEGRYYFTPKKMGAQTREANINAGLAAANQIVNFFKKGDTTFKVN
ncbi:MAG: 3-phosphoglycerate dehydrogenase [Bacteroidales bacterium]|nr:3-phosphoglycerate dehydrogenase [Bacteroidales bacterium]MCF8337952.1 3-phosphoglycerate dehydrogenase [Bacteroidales bacterium]